VYLSLPHFCWHIRPMLSQLIEKNSCRLEHEMIMAA
jgi:hypothetical protein